jgi:hypothetical protein
MESNGTSSSQSPINNMQYVTQFVITENKKATG